MDVPPPPELAQAVTGWPLPQDSLKGIPPMFFRMVWKTFMYVCYVGEDVDKFIEEDLSFIVTWYFELGGSSKVSHAQLKAGWNTVWRLYEADIQQFTHPEAISWSPQVGYVEFDGYAFEFINTPSRLYAEGKTMEHCIAKFTHKCRIGEKMVYAVSENSTKKRVA